jgi:hypothetical protein
MSSETETPNTNDELVIPSMTLEKVNSVIADLQNYVSTILKADKKHHAGLRVQAAIEDTININISDELRYDMYQMLRQTAKVWSMAEHLPQRISKGNKTQNEQNYTAQKVLAVNDVVALMPVSFIERLYLRPAHVTDEDKANGVQPIQRQHTVETFTAQLLKDHMRASNNLYDKNEVYEAIVEETNTEAPTDEVKG